MQHNRRTLLLVVPVLAFLLIATSLYLNRDFVSRAVLPKLHLPGAQSYDNAAIEPEETSSPALAKVVELLSTTTSLSLPTPSAATEPLTPPPSIGNGSLPSPMNELEPVDDVCTNEHQELFCSQHELKSTSMRF